MPWGWEACRACYWWALTMEWEELLVGPPLEPLPWYPRPLKFRPWPSDKEA